MEFLYFAILLSLLGFWFFKLPGYKKKQKFFQLLLWCFILLFVVFLYSVKDHITNSSFFANLVPSSGYATDKNTLVFKKASDGHFYISAKINNSSIKFLVDTGATDIVLSKFDAIRVGINTNALSYTKIYNTANGKIYAAPITVDRIKIKDLEMTNVKINVSLSDNLDGSLLGMDFLQHFVFYMDDQTLTIKHYD